MSTESVQKARSSDEPQPIPYATSPSVVSVRGFRLLIALTVLNTALLGWYVIGPQFVGFTKGQWNAYQQRKAERQREAKRLASLEAQIAAELQAMQYAAAPGTLVYDDHPARRAPDASSSTPLAPWPAVAPRPAEADALPAEWTEPSAPVLFLHARRASGSSPQRLIIVTGQFQPSRRTPGSSFRIFKAVTVRTTEPGGRTGEAIYGRNQAPRQILLPIDLSLRLYAGEPDPADESRFVIPYELADQRGQIHGQLQGDDSVRLSPDGPLADYWQQWQQ